MLLSSYLKNDLMIQKLSYTVNESFAKWQRTFLFDRKVRPMKQKKLRVDCTVAEKKNVAMRPAAGGESCKAGFFLLKS